MRALLDTHLLLWAALGDRRLPDEAQEFLEDPLSVPLFSVASIWEVAIKFSKGRSDFQVPPVTLRRGLLRNGYAEVPIEGGTAEVVQSLPAIHGDPFDRMLVAQARVLGVPLWTCDAKVSEYGPGVRLI